jgi:hypothetical protein
VGGWARVRPGAPVRKTAGAQLGQFFLAELFHRDAPEPQGNVRLVLVLVVKRLEVRIDEEIDEFHPIAGLLQESGNFAQRKKTNMGDVEQTALGVGPQTVVHQALDQPRWWVGMLRISCAFAVR